MNGQPAVDGTAPTSLPRTAMSGTGSEVQKTCSDCGRLYVFSWREHWRKRKLCDECVSMKRRGQPPRNQTVYVLALERLRLSYGLSRKTLCKLVGLNAATYSALMATPDRIPLQSTDDKLRDFFGEQLPVPLANGVIRRPKALQNLAKYGHRARTTAAQKRAAKTRRERPHRNSLEHRKRISVTATERHRLHPELGRRLGTFQGSFAGRALTSLRLRLAWWNHPERRTRSPRPMPATRAQLPRRKEIRSWEHVYARQCEVSQADVERVWEPWLKRVGLWSPAGRRRADARFELITKLMAEWRRTPSGKLGRGFWAKAEQEVARAEGPNSPDAESLKVFYHAHRS